MQLGESTDVSNMFNRMVFTEFSFNNGTHQEQLLCDLLKKDVPELYSEQQIIQLAKQ